VGWVAAYDFDFSEPSSPQRLPTREKDRSEECISTMDRKPYKQGTGVLVRKIGQAHAPIT